MGIGNFLGSIGRGVGVVVNALYQAGRDTVEQVVKNILPFNKLQLKSSNSTGTSFHVFLTLCRLLFSLRKGAFLLLL